MSLVNTEAEPLGAIEREELARHEAVIQRGLATFVEVGEALAEVREQRLYRETHATFEDYCRERWDLHRQNAYHLIAAAKTVSSIDDMDPEVPKPANLGQARELAGLEPEQAVETMRKAHEATDGKPTAKAIREARQPMPTVEDAVADFPELSYYVDRGRADEAIRIAGSLRTYDEPERTRRRGLLAKTIAAEQRADEEPPAEVPEENEAMRSAEQIFTAANAAASTIARLGAEDTLARAVADASHLELDNWRGQFESLEQIAASLARACKPTIRRVQ